MQLCATEDLVLQVAKYNLVRKIIKFWKEMTSQHVSRSACASTTTYQHVLAHYYRCSSGTRARGKLDTHNNYRLLWTHRPTAKAVRRSLHLRQAPPEEKGLQPDSLAMWISGPKSIELLHFSSHRSCRGDITELCRKKVNRVWLSVAHYGAISTPARSCDVLKIIS